VNYRHHFHAGNFADVVKHVLLVQLVRALQKKDRGYLYLDTHAGRGAYDLAAAATGDTLARRPEWPDGIGRLWGRRDLPPVIADYAALVGEFTRGRGSAGAAAAPEGLRFYPGSPWLVRLLARPQDRLALCEQHPGECAELRAEFQRMPRSSVHEMDGYVAVRAMLPPPERRGLILIDPPYESPDEFARAATALGEGLRRFPSGVFALWYPLTERARLDEFFAVLLRLAPPPTWVAEITIAGEQAGLKMRGCGLVIVNPPWQFDAEAGVALERLAGMLAQAPGGGSRTDWLVREK
jgi:23S rRNA (adenine2030-N6)-methyltransferase